MAKDSFRSFCPTHLLVAQASSWPLVLTVSAVGSVHAASVNQGALQLRSSLARETLKDARNVIKQSRHEVDAVFHSNSSFLLENKKYLGKFTIITYVYLIKNYEKVETMKNYLYSLCPSHRMNEFKLIQEV